MAITWQNDRYAHYTPLRGFILGEPNEAIGDFRPVEGNRLLVLEYREQEMGMAIASLLKIAPFNEIRSGMMDTACKKGMSRRVPAFAFSIAYDADIEKVLDTLAENRLLREKEFDQIKNALRELGEGLEWKMHVEHFQGIGI